MRAAVTVFPMRERKAARVAADLQSAAQDRRVYLVERGRFGFQVVKYTEGLSDSERRR